jgi:CBS domain-containing protein
MIGACPFCGDEIIVGDDSCPGCGQSLHHLSAPTSQDEIEERIVRTRISALGPRKPLAARPDEPVSSVLRTMVRHDIGCVVVVDRAGKLQGVFSERDAVCKLNTNFADLANQPVSQFMTPAPETLQLDDRVAFAIQKMDVGGYRHVPILNGNEVAGMISVRDILRHVTECVYG